MPLAEILVGVLRTLQVLQPDEVHAGYRVLTAEGHELDPGRGLASQGVRDGAVLTASVGAEQQPPKVYDDVVEAVADVVEEQAGTWTPQHARAMMLAAAAVLAVLSAWVLHTSQLSSWSLTLTAGVVALLAILAGAVTAKLRAESAESLVLFAAAGVFAVSAAGGGMLDGPPLLVAAGAGLAVVGAAGVSVLGPRGWPLVPAIVVGVIFAAAGGVVAVTDWGLAGILLVVSVVLVLITGVIPRYALSIGGMSAEPVWARDAAAPQTAPVEEPAVRRRVETAARLTHGLRLSVVAFHVLAAPVIVTLGPSALTVSWVASALIAVSARRDARTVDIVVAVAGAVASVGTATLGIVLADPSWALVPAVVLAVTAVIVALWLAIPRLSQLTSARMLDVAETTLLVALVPLTLLALDVLPLP